VQEDTPVSRATLLGNLEHLSQAGDNRLKKAAQERIHKLISKGGAYDIIKESDTQENLHLTTS
jgi:hypothetical protein